MKNILIYDDIPDHSRELAELLQTICGRHTYNIDIAATRDEAAALLDKKSYYIIFLDTELDEDLNGIDFAKEIQNRFPNTSLVYITAYIKYCEEIFRTSPDAFILKPFSRDSVKRAMEIVRHKRGRNGCISIAAGKNSIKTVEFDGIFYIETIARNLTFNDRDFRIVYEFYGIKLLDILDKLPEYFVRCHQSICVNMRKVRSIERYCFIMNNGREIPISQSRFVETRQRYLDFLGDML